MSSISRTQPDRGNYGGPHPDTLPDRSSAPGRRRRYIILIALPFLLFALGYWAVNHFDQAGTRFFNTGKDILGTLSSVSSSAKALDFVTLQSQFATDFEGVRLGLAAMKPAGERDGIHRFVPAADGTRTDRKAAIDEWKSYLLSFDSIEEVTLQIDRLEEYGSRDHLVATVRFELIGKLRGALGPGIDRAYFRFAFRDSQGRPLITSASLVEGERYYGDQPHFSDVSHTAGIDFVNQYYPGFLNQPLKYAMIRFGPGGIATADYDNDGFYDLFIPDGVASRLYRNVGEGRFKDVTAQAGLAGLDGVSAAVFADYDNDGYKDLFVSRTFKANQLFHNNGNGTFTDVTAHSRIGEDCCTTAASWADYDNDGYLDLYVGRYLDPRKGIPTTIYARNGEPNQLYHNNGDGTFTNVTEKAGVGDTGLCLGTVFGDYDDDGYPDLYVVNDFGRKTLYHNNRNGTFTDVTIRSGTLAYGAGMNASMADYDNDGRLDLYVTNIRSDDAWFAARPTVIQYMLNAVFHGVWKTDMPLYWQIYRQSGTDFVSVFHQMASGNNLLHNEGDGTFRDVTVKTNTSPVGWYWGASFADFDNDGWQDIYATDGWMYNRRGTDVELEFFHNVVTRLQDYKTGIFFDPKYIGENSWHGWERNRYFRNRGDGTFEEVATPAGNDLLTNSRGVAVADFWNRGSMDIAVSASGDRHVLLRNDVGSKRNWLQVELAGVQSNRDAAGARVTIAVKGQHQMREVVLGDGYGSQNSSRQHFGLGDATMVDEMTVRWPRSGIVQKFLNVAANRIVQVTEGNDQLVEKRYPRVAAR